MRPIVVGNAAKASAIDRVRANKPHNSARPAAMEQMAVLAFMVMLEPVQSLNRSISNIQPRMVIAPATKA